jgi:hypothetical protein
MLTRADPVQLQTLDTPELRIPGNQQAIVLLRKRGCERIGIGDGVTALERSNAQRARCRRLWERLF